jgi:starvation-inducible DNA-binding protein
MVTAIYLELTMKHIHWNVVGPTFISVHEMLDPKVDFVREMSDTIAERIATLGGRPAAPLFTPTFRLCWRLPWTLRWKIF